MQERIELIELLLSLTEDELETVISRASEELGLQLLGDSEPRHQTET